MAQQQNDWHNQLDEQSFTTLFNTYWEQMFAVCYQNSGDMEASKEMVQDIFRSLWEKRDGFQITHSIKHYLLRAAKLKACEYIRNRVYDERQLSYKAETLHHGEHSTEQIILYNELNSQVNTMVSTLSTQCQKVYKMSEEQGMSPREIASALLISEKTVSYHLSKAKDTLKVKLGKLYRESLIRQ
ncbi:sigma-70 family RNA polymerase sigma factor [Parapedobacter koreensis]|uniref:RNA polymerase sigma-70 factor, ECF subfamily n=1 Tax=Parapedobacter koreensis TaxID=332977 RepID=A0A1H7GI13_9SPHI|nr:sigma-70 family RNA polymerase sigma factor [Parapedobacter koreensis]SEK36582.1 RNA polymerase sigma-70 factor, ECF subfamily [Parapedobacter koreensis]